MTMSFGGMSGSFQGRYDQSLQDKIDKAFAGKASPQDKLQDFLKKDLGIDPGALPMTVKQARFRINTIMQERGAVNCTFTGNSLGIKHVAFTPDPGSNTPCTTCGNQDTYAKGDGSGLHYCYDCEADFTPPPPVTDEEITQNSKDKDWSDMMRVYKALQEGEDYSFFVARTHGAHSECFAPNYIHQEVEPDPRFLSVGLTVRLCKKTLGAPDEYVYAKKGGLFNDSDVVLLPGMQVITDISSWTVVEIL